MPALTLDAKKINLSYTFDAITIYIKYAEAKKLLVQVLTACDELGLLERQVGEPTEDETHANHCRTEIENEIGEIRFVHRNDDDHNLYHHDSFDPDLKHSHYKFKKILTEDEVNIILSLFVIHDLLTREEKNQFIQGFEKRFETVRRRLDTNLSLQHTKKIFSSFEVEEITRLILNFIKQIEDNDILIDVHNYLLSPKFDLLRINPVGEASLWQGTDEKNNIIRTSKSWANIERAIALQMAHNIAVGTHFTPKVAKDRTDEFSQHRFFSICHELRTKSSTQLGRVSPSVKAFSECDTAAFDDAYESVFAAPI